MTTKKQRRAALVMRDMRDSRPERGSMWWLGWGLIKAANTATVMRWEDRRRDVTAHFIRWDDGDPDPMASMLAVFRKLVEAPEGRKRLVVGKELWDWLGAERRATIEREWYCTISLV